MAYINYPDKRFLIVDNIKPSRDALKQYALSLNASRIDSTMYPNDVISLCREVKYDVIFLGYDLGEGQKNGQQILEELKTNQLIPRQCIVIIISGEISQSMVLAAIEHKPDEYLTKPYTINELTKRLLRSSKKKQSMADIYRALDSDEKEEVISLCNQALKNGTPYRLECLGIISRQYFALEQYELAQKIYLTNIDKPNCQWANIGLGKIAFYKNDVDGAIYIFDQLKQHYPCYLSTYDWLSKCYQLLEEFEKAEEILEQAISISPRSVVRLRDYAQLCVANEHYDKATYAFLETNNLAYNSVHHHPDNALNFVRSLSKYSQELSVHLAKKLNNKAFKALASMTKEFKQAELKIESNLLTACLFKNVDEVRSANEFFNQAKKQLEKSQDNLSPESLIEMCKVLDTLDEHDAVKRIMSSLIERCADDIHIMTEIDKLAETALHKEGKSNAQQALNVAANLYKNRDYDQAIIKLKKALTIYPEHLGIKLNLIQALLVSYESSPDKKALNQAGKIIEALNQCSRNHTVDMRYSKLKNKYIALADQ